MDKIKLIRIPIYDGNLGIVFTSDKIDIDKYVNVEFYSKEEIFCQTFSTEIDDKRTYLVAFNVKHSNYLVTNGHIAHECLHAANMCLGHIGDIASHENDETLAYLLDWMVDQVYTYMKEYKITIK